MQRIISIFKSVFLFLFCFTIFNTLEAASESNIFILDLETVGRESPMIAEIFQKIEAKHYKINELGEIQRNLDAELAELAENKELVKNYDQKESALNQEIAENKKEMNELMQNAEAISKNCIDKCQSFIQDAIQQVLDEKMQTKSSSNAAMHDDQKAVVLYKQSLAYFDPSMDITNDVKKALDALLEKNKAEIEQILGEKL